MDQPDPAALRSLIRSARAAWPDVPLGDDDFAGYLMQHLPAGAALGELKTEDLYLCCGCARGVPAALSAFERCYVHKVAAMVGHVDDSPAFVAEIQQRLRVRLLVGEGDRPPRINEYAGRGALWGWVCAVSLNLARDMVRAQGAAPVMAEAPPPSRDAELDIIKSRYAADFKAAISDAMATLSDQEHNVLALYYVDGLTLGQIGQLYGVNRSTIKRWRDDACAALFKQMRALLRQRLRLQQAEFESLMSVVRSQIDLSLARILRRT